MRFALSISIRSMDFNRDDPENLSIFGAIKRNNQVCSRASKIFVIRPVHSACDALPSPRRYVRHPAPIK